MDCVRKSWASHNSVRVNISPSDCSQNWPVTSLWPHQPDAPEMCVGGTYTDTHLHIYTSYTHVWEAGVYYLHIPFSRAAVISCLLVSPGEFLNLYPHQLAASLGTGLGTAIFRSFLGSFYKRRNPGL